MQLEKESAFVKKIKEAILKKEPNQQKCVKNTVGIKISNAQSLEI